MKEACNHFICDTGNTGATGAMPPQVQPATDSCAACVLAKVGPAQAYVPSQAYEQPMEQEQSLVCGTAFSGLVVPYCSGWHLYQSAKEA